MKIVVVYIVVVRVDFATFYQALVISTYCKADYPAPFVHCFVCVLYKAFCMMAALQNDRTENQLSAVVDGQFDMLLVSQVITETDSIFRKIQQELNLKDYLSIRQSYLNKRHVSKENLAEWLEAVCKILDSLSVPLLKNAVSTCETMSERIDELQREKIDDQRKIIQLKDEVLDKRSEELNDVKSIVLTE